MPTCRPRRIPAFKGRGVPDVAGDADPATGYQVQADGPSFAVGGTSAVAPLWAGLIALFNQSQGKAAGYLNPTLYQHGGEARAPSATSRRATTETTRPRQDGTPAPDGAVPTGQRSCKRCHRNNPNANPNSNANSHSASKA